MDVLKGIGSVIKNNLCIGCGLCVYACPSNALKMQLNEYGFLVPNFTGPCDSNGDCLKVCPFNPYPKNEIRTENDLADFFLIDAQNHHKKIGKFNGIYAGYSNEFRLTSSSGGIATYVFSELLSKGSVDYVFSVKESQKENSYYEYTISSSKDELVQAAKTKYYPVTLAEVISKIKILDGKIAIVGVACFIKAIRLAQYTEPALKEKIPFLVGIICGGIKSKFFTEYLASKAGVEKQNIQTPKFRIKDIKSTASDYSYGCIDKSDNLEKTIKMSSVGEMWGTGLFKANACDFCDDVTTELADISLGDAWLSPYNSDGRGTNVIVTRSLIAEALIENGMKKGDLTIEELPLDRFLASQQGSFNHRQTGLSVRVKLSTKKGKPIPPKRFGNEKTTIHFKTVQKLRMKIRRKSLEVWKDNPNADCFDRKMGVYLKQLSRATKIYHYRRAIARKVNTFIQKFWK